MMEFLRFTFQNGWHFLGVLILLAVVSRFRVIAIDKSVDNSVDNSTNNNEGDM